MWLEKCFRKHDPSGTGRVVRNDCARAIQVTVGAAPATGFPTEVRAPGAVCPFLCNEDSKYIFPVVLTGSYYGVEKNKRPE